MPRGYRFLIVALGLVLAAYHPGLVAQPKQAEAHDRSVDALENIATRYGQQTKGADRSNYEKPCAKGDDQRDSDLCAQWKAADSANIAAWLSGLSFTAVLAALWLAFKSNGIARDTGRGQLRAYVTIGNVELRRVSTEDGNKEWLIDFEIMNKGQTPAFIRHFDIMIGWRRKGVAEDIVERILSKDRAIQVVVASGQPFGVFVQIEAPFTPADLHEGHGLTIRGKIEYCDIFDQRRTTTYRLYADRDCWQKNGKIVVIHTNMTGNACT